MRIGGIQKLSLVDFPNKLSCVVFAIGCNFRCPFCHNPELVTGEISEIPENDFFDFLIKRKKQLDGVVISGGEPTLYPNLNLFIKKIRELGYAVKLDTNGTNPNALNELLEKKLVDFVAMDVKHVWDRYNFATGIYLNLIENIKYSAKILINSNIDYEFRTTVIRDFHNLEDIITISEQISGAKRYIVQEFIPQKTLDENFSKKLPFKKHSLETIIPEVEKNVKYFGIRQ